VRDVGDESPFAAVVGTKKWISIELNKPSLYKLEQGGSEPKEVSPT